MFNLDISEVTTCEAYPQDQTVIFNDGCMVVVPNKDLVTGEDPTPALVLLTCPKHSANQTEEEQLMATQHLSPSHKIWDEYQYHGYLYGHYDSRGGTTFIVAPKREVADWHYDRVHFANDDESLGWGSPAREDFIAEAILMSDEPLRCGDLEESGTNIDGDTEVTGQVWVLLGYGKTPEEVDKTEEEDDSLPVIPEGDVWRLQWIKDIGKKVYAGSRGGSSSVYMIDGNPEIKVTIQNRLICNTVDHREHTTVIVKIGKEEPRSSKEQAKWSEKCDCEPMPYGPRPKGKATHPRWDDDAYSFAFDTADIHGYLNDKTYKTIVDNIKEEDA